MFASSSGELHFSHLVSAVTGARLCDCATGTSFSSMRVRLLRCNACCTFACFASESMRYFNSDAAAICRSFHSPDILLRMLASESPLSVNSFLFASANFCKACQYSIRVLGTPRRSSPTRGKASTACNRSCCELLVGVQMLLAGSQLFEELVGTCLQTRS